MNSDKERNSRILLLLFIGVLMGALDISIVGPALPAIGESMMVEPRQMGWIFSIYLLFNLVGMSFFARLSDRHGRRSIYILAIAIFGLGSLLVSLSSNITILLVGRAIQGIGASGIFPVATATIGDIFPPEKRGKALGLIGAVFGIAFIIGPVLAGIMLRYFSWNLLFIINIPIAFWLLVSAWRNLPAEPVSRTVKMDYYGMFSFGVFLAFLTLTINLLDPKHFDKNFIHVLPYLVVALAAFFLFIFVELRTTFPIIKIEIFKSKQIRILSIISIGAGLCQAIFVFIPDLVIEVFGVTKSTGSFMLIPSVLASAAGAPLSGRLLDKFGSRVVVSSGLLFIFIGIFQLAFFPISLFSFYSSGFVFGFGLSFLVGSSLRYIMLNEVSKEERATTQGLISIFISIGQMAGSAGISAVIASFNDKLVGYNYSFIGLSLLISVLILASFRLRNRKEELAFISKNN